MKGKKRKEKKKSYYEGKSCVLSDLFSEYRDSCGFVTACCLECLLT